ncbi:hypothetical protein GCM10027072_54740 [Streptomyces bullii]
MPHSRMTHRSRGTRNRTVPPAAGRGRRARWCRILWGSWGWSCSPTSCPAPTAHIVIGVGYWLALVPLAARLRSVLGRPDRRRRWDRITGCLFVALGAGVAAAE